MSSSCHGQKGVAWETLLRTRQLQPQYLAVTQQGPENFFAVYGHRLIGHQISDARGYRRSAIDGWPTAQRIGRRDR